MIKEFGIKGYKSILDQRIELGRLNVFIGENGSGKTNILEAVAMAAAAVDDKLAPEELYARGVRVAKPSITRSSFAGYTHASTISFDFRFTDATAGSAVSISLSSSDKSIDATWIAWLSAATAGPKRRGAVQVRLQLEPDLLDALSAFRASHPRLRSDSAAINASDVQFLRPEYSLDETDLHDQPEGRFSNWELVKEECVARARIDEFLNSPIDEDRLVVIHIDADEAENVGYEVKKPPRDSGLRLRAARARGANDRRLASGARPKVRRVGRVAGSFLPVPAPVPAPASPSGSRPPARRSGGGTGTGT